MSKFVHYNLDNIDSKGATINIIVGERSNGKSYQVKHKKAVEKFWDSYKNDSNHVKRFILMRRLREEITPTLIEQYFQDVDVVKITNNEYNMITMYRKRLYLSHYNIETNKVTRGMLIGYVVALNTEQNYAGASYLDVEDIIFEEFMSRKNYLHDEPEKLMNFYCTVDRKRGTTRLWLLGNSITRVCPYLYSWELDKILFRMNQGDIKIIEIPTPDVDDNGHIIYVKVAIEYCKESGRSSFAIGKHAEMLSKGSWQTDPQPHLVGSYKDYKLIFRIGFFYKGFKFLGEFLYKDNNNLWFIKPYKGEFNKNTIVFSDIIKESINYQRDIYNVTIDNPMVKKVLDLFVESNIFYSDDLCGTEFKEAIDFTIRR